QPGPGLRGDRDVAREVPHRAAAFGARLSHTEGVRRDVSGVSCTETRGTLHARQRPRGRAMAALPGDRRSATGDPGRRGRGRNVHRVRSPSPPTETISFPKGPILIEHPA